MDTHRDGQISQPNKFSREHWCLGHKYHFQASVLNPKAAAASERVGPLVLTGSSMTGDVKSTTWFLLLNEKNRVRVPLKLFCLNRI